jgi:hypothetical protein
MREHDDPPVWIAGRQIPAGHLRVTCAIDTTTTPRAHRRSLDPWFGVDHERQTLIGVLIAGMAIFGLLAVFSLGR